ncbi:hypothetical protein CRYUN_Cryun16bG0013200 [Craigia yunnanensis]
MRKEKTGPHLPSVQQTAIDRLNPIISSDSDDEIDLDMGNDVYEYEEEDENVSSDDDDDNGDFDVGSNKGNQIEDVDGSDGVEEEDDQRHLRMLQGITGMSSDAFEVQDLLDPIQGKPGYLKLRKRVQHMDRKSASIQAALPKADREKLERMAVYEHSKKDITKWEHLVKRNREAPTIFFSEDVDLRFSTVGAIASEFVPRTEFEKKIASLVYDDKVMEAHKEDGSKLLEMNKDKQKAASVEMLMDPEAAKEQARKQELKRAEHKNKSKWARRILEHGLNTQDEGTRAAMSEQLHHHALWTRKINTVNDSSSSSSDSSSDEDDEGSDQDRASELLEKAKQKTLKVLQDDEEMPNSGVLSLPFMVRGMKKRREVSIEEAKLALQEYEQLEGIDDAVNLKPATASGRRVFGMAINKAPESNNKIKTDNNKMKMDNYYGNNDSEDDLEFKENLNIEGGRKHDVGKDVGPNSVCKEAGDVHQESVFKNFDDVVRDRGLKTPYEVAIFASDSWRKMKSGNEGDTDVKKSQEVKEPIVQNQDLEGGEERSDSDSEGQMVDGILSSGLKQSYELPSQSELIRHAFAGDDVEEEFEKDKQEILNGALNLINLFCSLREETLKKRKDAHLKHVIISEKSDKKAEKLETKTLPYPFTSKELFEQSMRMPIGSESNPETAIRALNRPEVVKKPGLIIKPIKFEEVHQHEKPEDHKRSGQKRKTNRNKGVAGKIKNP